MRAGFVFVPMYVFVKGDESCRLCCFFLNCCSGFFVAWTVYCSVVMLFSAGQNIVM